MPVAVGMRAAIGIVLAVALLVPLAAPSASAHHADQTGGSEASRAPPFDRQKALDESQQAIGRLLSEHRFTTSRGESFALSSTRGKPVLVTLVYTSCNDACPLIVQTLARAADVAASAVGADSFTLLTIGFDTRFDTPQRLHDFARAQGIDDRTWRFLSADAATIDSLAAELGFLFSPRAGGFDHVSQVSMIDAEGHVYRQIYGTDFPPQALVEPLKQLVFRAGTAPASFSGLLDRVKLVCTVYDPATGRYRFSYAIFIEILGGALSLGAVGAVLLRLWLQSRRPLPRGS